MEDGQYLDSEMKLYKGTFTNCVTSTEASE